MNWTLITGASSGIGKGCAELLARQGHPVWLVARRKDRLDALVNALKAEGCQAQATPLDLSKPEQIAEFSKQHQSQLKDVDVLINNAGLARGTASLQDGQLEHWEEMIRVNLTGLLQFTRAVLPHMVKKNHGHIVNLGSVAGRWAYPGGNVYCATKSAVRMLNECLRIDLNGKNIRITEIAPGMVETEFSLVRFQDSEKAKAAYSGMTPLTAKDIAETVAWCIDRPAHVNIQEVVIYPTSQASPNFVHRE